MTMSVRARLTSAVAASALAFTIAGTGAANAVDTTPAPPATVSAPAPATVGAAATTSKATTKGVTATQAQSTRDAMLKATGTTKYQYGEPIAMGPHANFTPYWWGMQFTLDSYAAKKLNDALASGKSISELVEMLSSLGVPMAPVVGVVIKGIMIVLNAVIDSVVRNTTEDGLVINSLWVPIPWTAKPAGPFVPGRQL